MGNGTGSGTSARDTVESEQGRQQAGDMPEKPGAASREEDSDDRRARRSVPGRLRRRVEDHRRCQGVGRPLGERRHDRRLLAHRTPHRRVRAVGRRAGRVRGRADREAGRGPDRAVRTRLLPSEHLQHAPVLPLISARPDSPDTVWKIGSTPTDGRFSRRRLENSIPHPSSWASTTFSQPSHCPGPHTCACSRSGTRAPASSTRPRR